MVARPQFFQTFATFNDTTVMVLENIARYLNKASGAYSTALGRGNNDVELSNNFMLSVLLGAMIADAKNAAVKVPQFGDMRLEPGSTRFEARVTEVDSNYNKLHPSAPWLKTVRSTPADGLLTWAEGRPLFGGLANLIDVCARNLDGDLHKQVQKGFELMLNLAPTPWAEMSLWHSTKDGIQYWSHSTYQPPFIQNDLPREHLVRPIWRRAAIDGSHITLLAHLWLDTLQRREASETNPKPPSAGSGKGHTMKPATPKKKSAGSLPGEPTPSGNRPHDDTPRDATRENQLPHSTDRSVRVCPVQSNRTSNYGTRPHDLATPQLVFA